MEFNFNPLITITTSPSPGQVCVVFDSNTVLDVERKPQLAHVPVEQFNRLVFDFEGFTADSAKESGDVKTFDGKVFLRSLSSEADAAKVELAGISLRLKAKGRAKKKPGGAIFEFPSQQEVQDSIRQGLARAASAAMVQYVMQSHGPAGGVPSPAPTVRSMTARGFPASLFSAANDDEAQGKRAFRRNLALAAVAGPVLVLAMIGIAKVAKPSDPIQQAVADAMAHNPAAANAQVDLVKQTLKEMNLDPGNGGDTGCLAQ